jgi:glycosyltransferase involved in cell wall biosynthesis
LQPSSKLLLPYRFLPFRIKHPIRQAIERFSTWKTERPDRDARRREIAAFAYKPKISIVTPVYNTPIRFLNAAIRSVRAQYYQNWELCICDDASTDNRVSATLRKWQDRDPRIKVHYSPVNEHISGASNHALALATGEFVGLLDHDDVITPDALYENVKLLQQHPDADMIYSDEDKLDVHGWRSRPFQKPDWDPELLLENMYTCHLGVYRKQLIDEIGGFRKGLEGSQDHDLVLRLSEKTDRIYHIPKVLYHWRMAPGSAAASTEAKPYAYPAAKRAIAEHLERRGIRAAVLDGEAPGRYKIVYNPPEIVADAPPVSIIVPNYNHARFLRQRIDTILSQTFQNFELILLDDASTDDSRTILCSYASDPRVRIEFNENNSGSPFKQWNKGVRLARGKYVWIAESDDYADPRLLEHLLRILDGDPEIAYAWCRLWGLSEDGKVDEDGDRYLRQIDESICLTDFCMEGRELCRKYFVQANLVPNASGVLFRKAVYERVGGADESLRVCGDWKLWAAMALTGKAAYLSTRLNYFRFHDSTARIRAVKAKMHVVEPLTVIRWVLRQTAPTEIALNSMRSVTSKVWVPSFLSMRTPLKTKRDIWRVVRDIDPHPFRSAFLPAMNTLRLKFRRHWRQLSAGATSRLVR